MADSSRNLRFDLGPARDVYSVSRLNREVRDLLEQAFRLIWIEGEISNLARPSSGHWYFSLKDASCQVRCAMFRQQNRNLGFAPVDGMQVLARARVGLYEARGEFQLVIEHLEEAGEGRLRREFEQLKRRLHEEGLFASTHKRPLPALPRRIGVITSPTGAAIRDILKVLARRFPAAAVLVYPVPVQGVGAAGRIAAAIREASTRKDCDVLLLARGGGSLEDLWPFNEEAVARAIFDCRIPLVTGIGHEIDVTIADFAADERAPTPSGAAEIVVPDRNEWLRSLELRCGRLVRAAGRTIERRIDGLGQLRGRLNRLHPGRRLEQHKQRLDELEQRLRHCKRNLFGAYRARLAEWSLHLQRLSPLVSVRQRHQRATALSHRLAVAARHRVGQHRHRLQLAQRALAAVGPQATLERGYAIVTRVADGTLVRQAEDVTPGEHIRARLSRGEIRAIVSAANGPKGRSK